MRYLSTANVTVLMAVLGAFLSFVGVAWLNSSPAVSGNGTSNSTEQKNRDVQQIQDLKQALHQSKVQLERERQLSVGLQRELRDVHSQIIETSKEAPFTTVKSKEKISPPSSEKMKQRATPQLHGALVFAQSHASSSSIWPINREHINAQVSPYAPRTDIRSTVQQPRGGENFFVGANTSKIETFKAAAFIPLPGRRPEYPPNTQRQYLPAATLTRSIKKPVSHIVAQRSKRSPRTALPQQPRDIKRSAKSKNARPAQTRKPQARRRRVTSSSRARMQRRAGLGRSLKRSAYRTKKPRRVRRKKKNLFNRFAGRGVFGDAYSAR